jgi:MFS transporter, DHA2 family, multidrug resistance protein
MAQTILERPEQFHVLRLNEKLDVLYPAVGRWFEQGRELFMYHTGDPVRSYRLALRLLQGAL